MTERKDDHAAQQEVADALEMIGLTKPKQIIQEVSGFVPVFEALLGKYNDHITALVFGRRWQYCRMEDGVCKASLETIAKDLKLSKATIMRHTDLLVKDGYLIDLTPDARNVPHIYADTGRVIMKSQLTATVSERNTRVSQRNATVSESHLIKDSIKDPIKEGVPPALDFKNMTVGQARKVPSIKLYVDATEQFPGSVLWETVHKAITENNLKGILEWAVNGIQTNGSKPTPEQKPAINESEIERARKLAEDKWNFVPAPPPAARPAIKQLAQQRGIRK
jgi:hypothetical protein